MKVVWRVSPAPVGRFRSFERRSWPMGYFGDDQGPVAAMVRCEDEYEPSRVKSGDHKPLELWVADYSAGRSFKWRRAKDRFANLAALKSAVPIIYAAHPEFLAHALA